jgi:choline dehydrogenase-like flavoprotein
MATGNLDIIPNAHAREVIVGKDGKATGVLFIDKTSGKEERVKGKAVILAAGACETVRILLNSKNNSFPNGLANSSGLVGKYIMDTVGARLGGHVPALENLPPHNEDGAGGGHFYAPWWLYKEQKAGKLDFARGYHIEMGGSRDMPGGDNPVPDDMGKGSYGTKFKEDARRYYGSFVGYAARGEMIPNENCYCDLDPAVKDKWGIPVLRFHWKWSDHEINQARHAQQTFAELIEAMGGTPHLPRPPHERPPGEVIEKPGSIIHEVGGTIIGEDPTKSVCNGWQQAWDAKNLILCDGAPFASNADKNPTLTIMALAWRACDHLVEEAKKGNL